MYPHHRARCFSLLVSLLFATAASAAIPVPLTGKAPVPLVRLRQHNPAVLELAGIWRFQLTHGQMTANGFEGGASGPVTASSSENGHAPQDVFDQLRTSPKWCADGPDMPQWWMVDMQGPQEVSGLNIDWEFADATYRFKVDGSLDGKMWKLLADRTAEPGVHSGPVPLTRSRLRWLRITITGANRPGNMAWACMTKVQITVLENGQETPWVPKLPVAAAPGPAPRPEFAEPGYNDNLWSNIPVPANWEMEGFSKPTYNNPDNAVGLYRRWIEVPKSFTGKRVVWHFDGVNNGAEIFINGQPVGYHEGGWTAFDVDVTSALRPGARNLLALRVSKHTPSVDLDTGDYWCLGGIYRENYLLALPPTHVGDIVVRTALDEAYKNATLNAAITVSGAPGAALNVSGELDDINGKRVSGVSLTGAGQIAADGTVTVQLQAPVTTPKLWSAEKPNLYYVMLTLSQNNQVVERVQERFGFRQIDIRNGVLLWNGVPIKCTGTCRHEEWARYGHALTEQCWETDLRLLKGANINAVRTSHYNHAARFLELCDEMGLYILDEVPGCWDDVKDPKLMPAFVQRTRETLERDQNRPCVLAWSLGNESGYGPNNQAMLDYAKAHDPTRPAFISQCGPWNNAKIDFADYHYPSLRDVKNIATDKLRATTPAVFTEQPHIFYITEAQDYDYGVNDFWGYTLKNNWDVVWTADGILGSFIWEWQDQGIADKFPGKQGVNPITGLRDNNNKGIVDGYRNVKPEYWSVKMVYSPVTTPAREVEPANGRVTVPLQNRYAFTDLAELTCRWQTLFNGKVTGHGDTHIACAPHATVNATFPATADLDMLRLEFIHPDGRSIYVARLYAKGLGVPVLPILLSHPGEIHLSDGGQAVQLDGGGARIIVDKVTGLIRSWTVNSQTVVLGGPTLNLGELRVTHGEHGAHNYIESKQSPQLRNAVVESKMNGDTAHISVTSDVYLVESPEPKAQLIYSLDLHPNGNVNVAWKLTWKAADANAWELGLKFLLPANADQFSWSRDGLWTEYPRDHIGANQGTVSSRDISFRSTKRNVQWAEIYSRNGYGLEAAADGGTLHARGAVGPDGTTFFLSSAVAPPQDFSTNLVPEYEIHLRKGETVSGGFQLGTVGGTGGK